jgi:hypothetical protein
MATREEIYTAIRNADKAGDSQAVQKLGAYLQTMDATHAATASKIDNDAISQGAKDPTQGMSTFDKVAAGAGKAFYDLKQGAGQLVGLTDRKDVQETKDRDAALMSTGAAKGGNLLGNLALTLPAFLVPGAATLPGAAAVGAAQGLLAPSTSTTETAQNVGFGGAAGAGGVAAGKVLAGLYQGGKALAEPFYQAGRDKIAGRVIQRFADDPTAVAAARGGPSITGAVPTIAEETGDAGMARLQDAVRSVDPQIAGRVDARLAQNNAARVGKLNDMAGKDGARDFASEMRSGTAKDLYDRAFSVGIEPENLSPAMRGEVTKLMQMPAIQDAMQAARQNAQNHGMKLDNMDASIAGLHQTKLAMDDAISALKDGTASQANKAAGIEAARDRLVSFMEKMSPDYRDARLTYAEMSKPLNQMDVASEVLKRGASSTTDLGRNVRLMPNSLTKLVQDDGESLVKQATGRKGLGGLDKVMTPEQKNMLEAIVSEVDRTGAVARAGSGPGSPTAQRMAAQNVLRQLVGPTGLPASWAESALANTVVGKPLNLLYGGVAEPKIQQALAEAVLDPAKARQMLQVAQKQGYQLPDNAITRLLANSARSAPSSTAVSRER